MPTRPRRKRHYDPAQLRGRILDTAAAEFQSHGYHATSMHDLMRVAQLSGGALYHHFPTKKSLGLAVIRERVASEIEHTWIAPLRAGDATAHAVIAVFDSVIAELDERHAVLGCPLNNLALELSLADPDFQLAVQDVFDRWRSAIADRIRADQAIGKLKAVDADACATFVVASFSGAMALAKAAQSSAPLRSCAQQLARAMAA